MARFLVDDEARGALFLHSGVYFRRRLGLLAAAGDGQTRARLNDVLMRRGAARNVVEARRGRAVRRGGRVHRGAHRVVQDCVAARANTAAPKKNRTK